MGENELKFENRQQINELLERFLYASEEQKASNDSCEQDVIRGAASTKSQESLSQLLRVFRITT